MANQAGHRFPSQDLSWRPNHHIMPSLQFQPFIPPFSPPVWHGSLIRPPWVPFTPGHLSAHRPQVFGPEKTKPRISDASTQTDPTECKQVEVETQTFLSDFVEAKKRLQSAIVPQANPEGLEDFFTRGTPQYRQYRVCEIRNMLLRGNVGENQRVFMSTFDNQSMSIGCVGKLGHLSGFLRHYLLTMNGVRG